MANLNVVVRCECEMPPKVVVVRCVVNRKLSIDACAECRFGCQLLSLLLSLWLLELSTGFPTAIAFNFVTFFGFLPHPTYGFLARNLVLPILVNFKGEVQDDFKGPLQPKI